MLCTLTERELEDCYTQVIKIFISHLNREEYISDEIAVHLYKTKIVVVRKLPAIVSAWKKLFKSKSDGLKIFIADLDISADSDETVE